MDIRIFPPKLRVLSSVPRFSIIPTIKTNDVASHSFYVAAYARQIVVLIGWGGPMSLLLWYALTHDIEESITGDIVGDVKRNVVDKDKLLSYVDRKMSERMPEYHAVLHEDDEYSSEIVAIVKAADLLDALFFIQTEVMMGNRLMKTRMSNAVSELYSAWMKLPHGGGLAKLAKLWLDVVSPAILEHDKPETYGL